jgi:hypothetical protein
MPQALPANPDLDWLKKAAKKRLVTLRAAKPTARLYEAQLAVANDYGFKSWRALKAHVETVNPRLAEHDRVFDAARAGDIEAVRRALASGFDPATPHRDGRTIFQIAKERRHRAIEMLTREVQGGPIRSGAELEAVQGIASAAQSGDVEALRQRLDARPDLINALAGRGFPKPPRCTWRPFATSTRLRVYSSSAVPISTPASFPTTRRRCISRRCTAISI